MNDNWIQFVIKSHQIKIFTRGKNDVQFCHFDPREKSHKATYSFSLYYEISLNVSMTLESVFHLF